jgi:hypothetical protein
MAQGPIDYTSGFGATNPLGGALEAMQAGARFGVLDQQRAGLQQQQMMREQQMLAAQAEQERQGQMAAAVDALIQNPNATRADYDRLAVLMPKDQREGLIGAFNARSTEQQGNDLRFAGQIESALVSGNPTIAQQLITERAAAERNSGREDQARAYETWAKIAETSPDALRVVVGNILATLPGGGAVLDSIGKVRGEARTAQAFVPEQAKRVADAVSAGVTAEFAPAVARASLTKAQAEAVTASENAAVARTTAQLGVQQTQANIRNLNSQISDRAERLRLDKQKLAEEAAGIAGRASNVPNVPEFAQKGINEAAVGAAAARQEALRLEALAGNIRSIGTAWGSLGSASEWLKRSTGSQGAVTELRQEYTRLRNNAAIKSLPPGPATDRDIELALSGFPPATANPAVISSFLTGMAKMQQLVGATEAARADWLANNRGSLGRAGATFQAGDFAARQGESYADFTARVAADLAKPAPGTSAAAIEQIPGQGAAAMAAQQAARGAPAAASSIREQADAILRGGR